MGKLNLGIKKIAALLVIVALIAIVAVPAFADSTATAPTAASVPMHTLQGKVTDISNSSATFSIQNGNQQPISTTTDGNTKFYLINMGKAQNYVNSTVKQDNQQARKNGRALPPRANDLKNAHIPANWRDNFGWLDTFNTQAAFSDIQVGDRVIVRATNDGNNLAKQVLIIKAPVNKTVKGTVISATSNSISLTPAGSSSTLQLNVVAQTRILLKGTAIIEQGETIVAVYNSVNGNALTVNIQAAQ